MKPGYFIKEKQWNEENFRIPFEEFSRHDEMFLCQRNIGKFLFRYVIYHSKNFWTQDEFEMEMFIGEEVSNLLHKFQMIEYVFTEDSINYAFRNYPTILKFIRNEDVNGCSEGVIAKSYYYSGYEYSQSTLIEEDWCLDLANIALDLIKEVRTFTFNASDLVRIQRSSVQMPPWLAKLCITTGKVMLKGFARQIGADIATNFDINIGNSSDGDSFDFNGYDGDTTIIDVSDYPDINSYEYYSDFDYEGVQHYNYDISFHGKQSTDDLKDLNKTITVNSAGGGGSYKLDVYKDKFGNYWVARHNSSAAECLTGVSQVSLGVNFVVRDIKNKI